MVDEDVLSREAGNILEEYVRLRDNAVHAIVVLRVNRLVEVCRRHLEGLTLKTTYNEDKIKALKVVIAKTRQEITPLLLRAEALMLRLRLAETELEEYSDAQRQVKKERLNRAATGMYYEPRIFIDSLYKDYAITRGQFAALKDEDIIDIVNIIQRRAGPLATKEAIDQATRMSGI